MDWAGVDACTSGLRRQCDLENVMDHGQGLAGCKPSVCSRQHVSHQFRYKILSLPPRQLDIQPEIAMTQLQEQSSTN